jgi:hypothetical protein
MTGPSKRWPLLIALSVVTLLAVVGVVLVRTSRATTSADDDSTQERAAAATTAQGGRPSVGDRDDGPVEDARDEAGAVEAALAYTAASQRWLYLSDDDITQAVTDIATPEAADRLAGEVVDEVRTSRDGLALSPGRVWWLVHPLAWRVHTYSRDEATVAVWTMTVLSAAEVAVPQSAWMTVTVDLEWTGGAWRVDAVRDRPGPTPMTGPRDEPWDSRPFDDALDGFTRLSEEPAT